MSNGIIGFYDYPYFVTFRIDTLTTSKPEYDARLTALYEAIGSVASSTPWKDATSCIVFRSNKSTGEIAALVARALHMTKDVALVASVGGPGEARLIGKADDQASLMAALPYTTKL